MKVKNLTNEMRPLRIVDLSDNRELTIYVEGQSSCELLNSYVADRTQLQNAFELIDNYGKTVYPIVSIDIVEEYNEELTNTEVMNSIDDPGESEIPGEDSVEYTSLEKQFICDICGAEFGSERGLNTHKNRSHQDKDDK